MLLMCDGVMGRGVWGAVWKDGTCQQGHLENRKFKAGPGNLARPCIEVIKMGISSVVECPWVESLAAQEQNQIQVGRDLVQGVHVGPPGAAVCLGSGNPGTGEPVVCWRGRGLSFLRGPPLDPIDSV